MSDAWDKPWSNNPNAPQIIYWEHPIEKGYFAGMFLGVISYGIVIALFFQCMSALINPVNRATRTVKWGLVVHTSVMFTIVTTYGAMYIDSQLVAYIDKREFGRGSIGNPTGPLVYLSVEGYAATVAPTLLFALNQCLADGFLLYRCCIIYSMNYWIIVFSCLMYLGSMGLGIIAGAFHSRIDPGIVYPSWFLILYCTLSLFLNVFLTLAIVTRLVLHNRNIRNAMGATVEANRLYKSIISMLVESCALYAGSLLAYIATSYFDSPSREIFPLITAEIQVIAPFLIILRVANRTAVTSDSMASRDFGSIRFRSQGQSRGDDGILPDGNPVSSMEMSGEAPGEVGVVAENAIEEVPLEGPSQSL